LAALSLAIIPVDTTLRVTRNSLRTTYDSELKRAEIHLVYVVYSRFVGFSLTFIVVSRVFVLCIPSGISAILWRFTTTFFSIFVNVTMFITGLF